MHLSQQINDICNKYFDKMVSQGLHRDKWMYRGERLTDTKEHKVRVVNSLNFPGSIHLDITNHCNRQCSFCFMKDRYSKRIMPLGYMDINMYQGIIDQCVEEFHGQPEIHLHKDGEPLIHPRVGEMIHYAHKSGCYTHFATNGFWLWEKRDQIIDSGLDLLTVSMEDDKALEVVRKFVEYKGDRKPDTQIKVFREYPWYNDVDLPSVDNVLIRKVWTGLKDKERNKEDLCQHLYFNPAITWDGYFVLCCSDWQRNSVIGNVKEEPIKMIWRVARYIRELQSRGVFLDPCDRCHRGEELYYASTQGSTDDSNPRT